MNFKPKVWHLILILCIALVVVRFTSVIKILLLLLNFAVLIFSDFSNALSQANFELLDYFISGVLIIIIPLLILFKFSKRKFFQTQLNFATTVITLLIFVFLFAPIISSSHPDFQKNIGITKLLPPLSKINYLKLEKRSENVQSRISNFVNLKNEIIKSSFDENLVFVDSVNFDKNIQYFQKQNSIEISADSLRSAQITPTTGTKYFIFGTDEFGRDILARLIYGARISIFVGFCAVFLSFIIGFIFGSASGYFGGIVDVILNRFTDTFLSFPAIFLVIIILALFGNSLFAVIFVLGFSGWMSLFKIVRAEVISLKQKDFFISAKMIGLSAKQLLLKEVLPVILTPIIVNLVFQFGSVVLAEAALSYLGLGTGSNYPSWGGMIDAGQNYLKNAWWMIFFPGIALIITLYSANDLGQKIKIYFNPQLGK